MYETEFKNITNKALELGPQMDKFREKAVSANKESYKVVEFVTENLNKTVASPHRRPRASPTNSWCCPA